MCGDGVCESPWEFASYSSFGCRADCGKLQDVQNLTSIQVDLAWNFGHPLGSTPAAVSWGWGGEEECVWGALYEFYHSG